MENINKFIKEFIELEFNCHRLKWDISVTDQDVEAINKKLKTYFHPVIQPDLTRIGSEFSNEVKIELAKKKLTKIHPRILFQIKHYINPKLGDALARFVTGKDIYACYLSYNQSGGRELYFSSIYFVSETNEGLKIIYTMSFDSKKGIWYHPNELDTTRVINLGKLIEVEKYQAPEEESSLLDYNKN
jgi:hypothetical protein